MVVIPGVTCGDDPSGVSDCDSGTGTGVPVVSVVAVVSVSLSSVVTEVCDGFSLDSVWEFVEPESFSFSKKRSSVLEENQGEMRYEWSPVQAPPNTRRRDNATYVSANFVFLRRTKVSAKRSWKRKASGSIQEGRVMAAMKNYLEKNVDIKVEVEALKLLMDPEESDVCLMCILAHARRRGSRIFEIF